MELARAVESDIEIVTRIQQSVHDYLWSVADELPDIPDHPMTDVAIQMALSATPSAEGTPDGWEERHRNVLVAWKPELAEAFDDSNSQNSRYYGRPMEGFKDLLAVIAVGEYATQSWADQAECRVRGIDPREFHTDIEAGRMKADEKKELKKQLIALTQVCRMCEVREQCLQYGLKEAKKSEGIHIYGGMIMQAGRKGGPTKVKDPYQY